MIDFRPSDEQGLVSSSLADFAKTTFEARARAFEVQGEVAPELVRQADELGLPGLLLPESAGGQAQGLVTAVLVEEELGAADAATASVIGVSPWTLAALELGAAEADLGLPGAVLWSEERPSAEPGLSTRAARDGDHWVLDGAKCFVSNLARAERLLVFAQVGEGYRGLGAFVVPRGAPGVEVGARHATLGLDAVPYHAVTLRAVRVPAAARLGEGDLTDKLAAFFSKLALVVAARAVGVSRKAFELAREHCDTRVAFGKPIGHFQAVAFTLADRLIDLDSSRWLVHRAASAWDEARDDRGRRAAMLASARAGASALEAAMRTSEDCVQLHGGAGFIRDVLAEKLMRDAKQLALTGATAETLDQLAAALELGLPLDPALVLPLPETQAVFT